MSPGHCPLGYHYHTLVFGLSDWEDFCKTVQCLGQNIQLSSARHAAFGTTQGFNGSQGCLEVTVFGR